MAFGAVAELVTGALDKFVPDANQKIELKKMALQAALDGEFKELDRRMDAIIMEAKSADPWTSRARPSFMYVVYTFILAALPMGIVFAAWPENAQAIVDGVHAWLEAIPPGMWATFTAGYLGYTRARSDDKARILGHDIKPGLLGKLMG